MAVNRKGLLLFSCKFLSIFCVPTQAYLSPYGSSGIRGKKGGEGMVHKENPKHY